MYYMWNKDMLILTKKYNSSGATVHSEGYNQKVVSIGQAIE